MSEEAPKVRTHSVREVTASPSLRYWLCGGCDVAWPSTHDRVTIEAEHCIPDLEFLPPDCPICDGNTDYDGDFFVCGTCDVQWPKNGQGGVYVGDEPELERQPCGTPEARS